MNNDELNTKLYEKMFAEQDTFRDWLLGQEPAAVIPPLALLLVCKPTE